MPLPDIIHVHIPRTAGTALKQFLARCGYRILDLDFITNLFPEADVARWRDGRAEQPFLFTGHLRLGHAVVREAAGRAAIITVLRDPRERLLSNYNFSRCRPDAIWHEELVTGRMSFLDHVRETLALYGPQYAYFDPAGDGDWRWTGTATAHECLNHINDSVTAFGFVERLPEFIDLLRERLDLPAAPLRAENSVESFTPPDGVAIKTALTADERTALTGLLRDDIWFYEQARSLYTQQLAARTSAR